MLVIIIAYNMRLRNGEERRENISRKDWLSKKGCSPDVKDLTHCAEELRVQCLGSGDLRGFEAGD